MIHRNPCFGNKIVCRWRKKERYIRTQKRPMTWHKVITVAILKMHGNDHHPGSGTNAKIVYKNEMHY
jgi:hypothetical protein